MSCFSKVFLGFSRGFSFFVLGFLVFFCLESKQIVKTLSETFKSITFWWLTPGVFEVFFSW